VGVTGQCRDGRRLVQRPAALLVVEVPVDGGASLINATVWGDILTEIAHRRGIAGTVIDGVCRDVALRQQLGYPVFSKDHWMRTGKDRVQVEVTGVPVTIGDARVAPGDIVRGGMRLDEARRQHRYHQLQTRESAA
jgi:regulator of RNase E activity RraA